MTKSTKSDARSELAKRLSEYISGQTVSSTRPVLQELVDAVHRPWSWILDAAQDRVRPDYVDVIELSRVMKVPLAELLGVDESAYTKPRSFTIDMPENAEVEFLPLTPNEPPYYNKGGLKAYDIAEAYSLHEDAHLFNALLYILRCKHKHEGEEVEDDIKKARFCLTRWLHNHYKDSMGFVPTGESSDQLQDYKTIVVPNNYIEASYSAYTRTIQVRWASPAGCDGDVQYLWFINGEVDHTDINVAGLAQIVTIDIDDPDAAYDFELRYGVGSNTEWTSGRIGIRLEKREEGGTS